MSEVADADTLLHELAAPEDASTSIRELLRCVMVEFDGPAGLARAAKLAFDENTTGNSNQIRLLSDLFRLLTTHGSEEEGEQDLESLEATAKRLLKEA